MRALPVLASAVVLLLSSGELARAQQKPIVAVFDLEVKGVNLEAGTVDRLTDYLGSLLGSRGYRIVPRSQLRERLAEAKRGSYRSCFDESCQIEIGKELAAQKSLTSQVLKIGSQCKITLNLFDLKQAASEGSGTATGECSEDGVVGALEIAVEAMLGKPVPAGSAPGKPRAPDLAEYERLAAQAEADEASRQEAVRQRAEYRAALVKAWEAIKKVAVSQGMAPAVRAGAVRKFLLDFPGDNPHATEAEALLAKLDQGQEPLGGTAGMLRIPTGEYTMGCNPGDDTCQGRAGEGAHKVWLSEFWIDATEVTAEAYTACLKSGGCSEPRASGAKGGSCTFGVPGKEQHPITCVDWFQAQEYCAWAAKRLPTEAEWEKAARGGTTGALYDRHYLITWNRLDEGRVPQPVAKKKPNAFGLYDPLGNAREWCADWFDFDYYISSPARDPQGPATGKQRVVRGGTNHDQRVSHREGNDPEGYFYLLGFRCAKSASP